jgi:DNA mismatch repair protein MutS2
VGTIDKIDRKSITINYGIFTTKTSVEKIELVEKAK